MIENDNNLPVLANQQEPNQNQRKHPNECPEVEAIDILIKEKLSDSEENLEKLKRAYTDLEIRIRLDSHKDDIWQAILRIQSGKIILKAKQTCTYGTWEVFAITHFNLSTEERKIRQKVAKLKDIEKYYNLGWKRIKALAQAVDTHKFTDPIDKIFQNISYTLELEKEDDFEMFTILIEAFIINEKLFKKKKINIQLEHIADAVEVGLKFDKKLLDKLYESKNPTVTLLNMIDFETPETKPRKQQIARCRELALLLENLTKLGKQAIDQKYPMKSIELYLLEDGAHYITELFKIKCKEEGLDWEK